MCVCVRVCVCVCAGMCALFLCATLSVSTNIYLCTHIGRHK